MKKNRVHARCIAAGLKYIEKENFDYVILWMVMEKIDLKSLMIFLKNLRKSNKDYNWRSI